MSITYGKIKTNRVKLRQYLSHFSKQKQGDETFLAPRPRPGNISASYFAIMKFPSESKNRTFFTASKLFVMLTEKEYEEELAQLGPYWEG